MSPSRLLRHCLRLLPLLALVAPPCWAFEADGDRAATSAGPRALLDQVQELRLQKQYAAMESLATVVQKSIEQSARPDTVLLVEALYDILHSCALRMLFSDSVGLKAGLRGLELLDTYRSGPDTLAFNMHRQLGYTYTYLRNAREGVTHNSAAVAIARRHPEWGLMILSAAIYQSGVALTNLGLNDSALAVYSEALELRRQIQMPRDVLFGEIYAGMGMIYEQQGQADLAEEAFALAMRTNEEKLGPTHPFLVGPLTRAAAFESRRGDYAKAIDYNQRALDVIRAAPVPDEANVLIIGFNIAQGLEDLGDVERARSVYEQAVPPMEAILGRGQPQVLGAWLSLASASAKLGDTDGALKIYGRVQEAFANDTSGTEQSTLAKALVSAAAILAERDAPDSALALARGAEDISRSGGAPDQATTLQALSIEMSVHADRGEWDEVDRTDARLQSEMERFALRGNNEIDVAWITRSEVASSRGRHADAMRAAAEGARGARDRLQRNVRSLSDRQALLLANTLSKPLDQLLRVGAHSDAASVRLCWDEVVRARGLVREEVSRRRVPPEADSDSALARAHEAWVRAARRLAQFEVHAASSVRDAASDSTLAALRAGADEAERRLMHGIPTERSEGGREGAGLDSVLAALAPDQALVGFVHAPGTSGGQRLLAFVGRGRSPRIQAIDLGEVDEVDDLIAAWRRELGEPDLGRRSEEACRREGAQVRARVWDPIARATKGMRDLFLVPEAPVAGLPWAALPVGREGYLVESTPRIHVLDAERELLPESRRRQGSGLLAIGGVNYESAQSESVRSVAQVAAYRASIAPCDSAALSHLPPLPGTASEVGDVEAVWSNGPASFGAATRLEGENATEAELKRLAASRQVVHLATHGIVLSDTCGRSLPGVRGVGGVGPLAGRPSSEAADAAHAAAPPVVSAAHRPSKASRPSPWLGRRVLLALADANHAREHLGDENEGLLTADEVTTLDLRGIDWVVLSACQSAAGEAWTREGVLGMQRAFHLAGARTVIASQWSVEDEATREWMRALYEARSRGALRAADAMASASSAVLEARRRSHRSTHPFYWAAFTASGE